MQEVTINLGVVNERTDGVRGKRLLVGTVRERI